MQHGARRFHSWLMVVPMMLDDHDGTANECSITTDANLIIIALCTSWLHIAKSTHGGPLPAVASAMEL